MAAFGAATSDAWIPSNSNNNNQCSSIMGSRQSDDNSKRQWLESRGFRTDGGLRSSTMDAEIIGAGRIGSFLAEAPGSTVLRREDTIDPNKSGPILIATRNDALDGIVDSCPENRKKDLMFLQK